MAHKSRKLSQAEQEQQDIQAGKYRDKKYDLPNMGDLADAMSGYPVKQQRVVDVTDRPIAEKLHTFANEISNDILEAERAKCELQSIRATLLVNFMQQNHFGFTIPNDDSVSTEKLVVMVLEKLCKVK